MAPLPDSCCPHITMIGSFSLFPTCRRCPADWPWNVSFALETGLNETALQPSSVQPPSPTNLGSIAAQDAWPSTHRGQLDELVRRFPNLATCQRRADMYNIRRGLVIALHHCPGPSSRSRRCNVITHWTLRCLRARTRACLRTHHLQTLVSGT